MSKFVRSDNSLIIKNENNKDYKIQFIKTKTCLDQKYRTVILCNHETKPVPNLTDTISSDTTYLLSQKITPTIFYTTENNKETKEYLSTYGPKIKEIFLPKENSYTAPNVTYFEEIKFIQSYINSQLLGILLALYLHYNRICYCYPMNIDLDSIDIIKQCKETYNISNKIYIHNCSSEDNMFLAKQNLNKILKPIILIQQFFEHKNPQRQQELVQCLETNVKNQYIDKIILLNEKIYDLPITDPKITQININQRVSYYYILNYIKYKINNAICIFSNTDIYFNHTLQLLHTIDLKDRFLALLRYNIDKHNHAHLHHDGRPDSQDAWIIDSDISIDIGNDFKFQLGKPGCDNAITYIMMKHRYVVSNPSLSIKCYHLHQTEIRDYTPTDLVITPFYHFTFPTKITPLKKHFKTIHHIDNSILEPHVEEQFERKNPFSYFDISKLMETRNKNASDPLPLDGKNKFIRHQDRFIAKLTNGMVGTDGLIYTKTHRYIINPIFDNIEPSQTSSVQPYTKLATVVQKWGYGFYHFVCEQLPKILYVHRHLPDLKILTQYNQTFIKELLECCLISQDKIVPFDPLITYQAQELYVPKPIYCGNPSKEDIQLIRDYLHIKDIRTEKPIGIIIKRPKNRPRSMINFDYIASMISHKDKNRKWHVFEHLSIKASIQLFQKADIVIAPHGAGLANMIFCARDTHIVEYVIEEEPNLCYWHLSELLGHHYYCIPVQYKGLQKSFMAPFDFTIDTLYRINQNKLPTVHKPFRRTDRFNHIGDTFREMIDLWEDAGYIKVIPTENLNPWVNGISNILLYDRPTYDWFIPSIMKYKLALFGNPNPPQDQSNTSPWIFWARRPRLLEKYDHNILSYKERDILSAFMGKIENKTQHKNRTTHDWSTCMEIFEMPIKGEYKYTQEQYLQIMRRVKYGLCLPGFGGKCNREIELMGLGVVPIFIPGVNRSYYNRLKKNVHYLFARNPREVTEIIKKCNKKIWTKMSNACHRWYHKNCSVKGSFHTTIEIIQKCYPKALENSYIVPQTQLCGTTYGGFYLPQNIENYLDSSSTIYLFGVGEDVTFDTYLAGKLDCPVYMFDPTPRSIEHVRLVKTVLQTKEIPEYNKKYGGGDKNYWKKIFSYCPNSNHLIMKEYGIYTEDTELKFYKPENSEYIYHSLVEGMGSTESIIVPVKKIQTIMNHLNHQKIDLIKLDVEGVECMVIDQMFASEIFPKFICIEFDIARNTKIDGVKIANQCFTDIKNQGYTLLHRNNLDMSFMKIS